MTTDEIQGFLVAFSTIGRLAMMGQKGAASGDRKMILGALDGIQEMHAGLVEFLASGVCPAVVSCTPAKKGGKSGPN